MSGRGLSSTVLVPAWLALAGLVAGAWYGVPVYVDGLEGRILYAAPDCMDVSRARAADVTLDLQARGDSLEVWMRGCLLERQDRMAARADLVSYGSFAALLTLSILLTALTLQSLRYRFRGATTDG